MELEELINFNFPKLVKYAAQRHGVITPEKLEEDIYFAIRSYLTGQEYEYHTEGYFCDKVHALRDNTYVRIRIKNFKAIADFVEVETFKSANDFENYCKNNGLEFPFEK